MTDTVYSLFFDSHHDLAVFLTDEKIAELARRYPPAEYTAEVNTDTLTLIVRKRGPGDYKATR